MKIAYFVNCYPQASHSFIRREIAALEELGMSIERISIRRPLAVVDPADQAELGKTFVIFNHLPLAGLLAASWKVRHPIASLRSFFAALRIGFRAGEPIRHLLYWFEALALARWLKHRQIGHVHAHFGTNAATVVMLCRLAGGASYSVTIHGSEEFDAPQKLALGEKVHHAAFIAVVSQFCRSQVYRWCVPADWNKIHIIRCGVDSGFLENKKTSFDPTPRLVCVGRLHEQKGQQLLVAALAQLVAEGSPAELLLVGDGPARTEIENLIRRHHLEKQVRITGWQSNSEVRQHILSARALVLPSFAEGLPVVIMEAFAMGRPAISTYVGGIPELVQPGVSGWLIPASNTDGLIDAMREALTMPTDRLSAMGAAGAARVRENHDCRVEAEKMLPLFSAVMVDHERTSALSPAGRDAAHRAFAQCGSTAAILESATDLRDPS